MRLIDGLPGIFKETFGEETVYTPKGGAPKTITAIWIERGVEVAGLPVPSDGREAELHVDIADVASPKEGDVAERVKDGKTMRVVPPILPDDQGMTACTLEDIGEEGS
jgi:hypothetical protein